ncbi:MAG: hypothetical protein QOD41_3871 [Cryptosporangiaceae bacterium]|nr:hypothetical protein [Cryptosporangiaceae bacterium]
MVPPTLSRRAVLTAATAAGIAAATSACDRLTGSGAAAVPPAQPDPLEPLLAAELGLVAGYEAAIARFPGLAGKLGPIRDEHRKHAQAIRATLDPRRQTAAPGDAKPAAAAGASAEAATAALAAEERAAAGRAAQACVTAGPERAALLASISASEAVHAVVLG